LFVEEDALRHDRIWAALLFQRDFRLHGWRASFFSRLGRCFRERRGAPAMKPEITLIKKSGPNPIMSKRIFLDEQGKVCSDGSQCLMAQGTATRATAETAADLAQHIIACGTDQAIVLGALRAGLPNPAQITTSARLKDNPGA